MGFNLGQGSSSSQNASQNTTQYRNPQDIDQALARYYSLLDQNQAQKNMIFGGTGYGRSPSTITRGTPATPARRRQYPTTPGSGGSYGTTYRTSGSSGRRRPPKYDNTDDWLYEPDNPDDGDTPIWATGGSTGGTTGGTTGGSTGGPAVTPPAGGLTPRRGGSAAHPRIPLLLAQTGQAEQTGQGASGVPVTESFSRQIGGGDGDGPDPDVGDPFGGGGGGHYTPPSPTGTQGATKPSTGIIGHPPEPPGDPTGPPPTAPYPGAPTRRLTTSTTGNTNRPTRGAVDPFSDDPSWYDEPATPGTPDVYTPGAQTGAPEGGLYGWLNGLLNSTGYSDAEKNAITQQGMRSTRAGFAGASDALTRHQATTGNSAGYYGAQAQLGSRQASALGDEARANEIAFGQEQERRRELGGAGMQGLYGIESGQTGGLMAGLSALSGLQSGSTSAGINQGRWNSSGQSINGNDLGAIGKTLKDALEKLLGGKPKPGSDLLNGQGETYPVKNKPTIRQLPDGRFFSTVWATDPSTGQEIPPGTVTEREPVPITNVGSSHYGLGSASQDPIDLGDGTYFDPSDNRIYSYSDDMSQSGDLVDLGEGNGWYDPSTGNFYDDDGSFTGYSDPDWDGTFEGLEGGV